LAGETGGVYLQSQAVLERVVSGLCPFGLEEFQGWGWEGRLALRQPGAPLGLLAVLPGR
ncbi:hypothetical protein CLOM_g11212, partial [Closterium sp. NIES-68]